MKKVLVTIPRNAVLETFFPEKVRGKLEEGFNVEYNQTDRQFVKDELREKLRNFDAVMTGWGTPMLDESVLGGNERLCLIVHTGGTVGNLVDSYAYDHGLHVFSGNRLYAESAAEGTLAYMLMGQRRLPYYIDRVRAGEWRTEADVWEGLLDKSVGIVGMGAISSYLIRMLQVFRAKIKVFSHYPLSEEYIRDFHCEQASLEEIFSGCDIVSVHSALNDQNRGMIRKKHFDLLKDGALFVNTSRGDVIDEDELIQALRENRFRAVLDVYQKEPLSADSPLRSLPNVLSVPHMAGPTLDRRPIITSMLIDEMKRFFDGETAFELEISPQLAARMTKMKCRRMDHDLTG